jgi:hypothetical protein
MFDAGSELDGIPLAIEVVPRSKRVRVVTAQHPLEIGEGLLEQRDRAARSPADWLAPARLFRDDSVSRWSPRRCVRAVPPRMA